MEQISQHNELVCGRSPTSWGKVTVLEKSLNIPYNALCTYTR